MQINLRKVLNREKGLFHQLLHSFCPLDSWLLTLQVARDHSKGCFIDFKT